MRLESFTSPTTLRTPPARSIVSWAVRRWRPLCCPAAVLCKSEPRLRLLPPCSMLETSRCGHKKNQSRPVKGRSRPVEDKSRQVEDPLFAHLLQVPRPYPSQKRVGLGPAVVRIRVDKRMKRAVMIEQCHLGVDAL